MGVRQRTNELFLHYGSKQDLDLQNRKNLGQI